MYGNAECAFNAMDFSGLGYVTKQAFLESIVIKEKVSFNLEQFQTFFNVYNLFSEGTNGVSLDTFKKIFFPQLYLVQEDKDDSEEMKAKEMRQQIDNNRAEQPKLIEQRIKDLEIKIKLKFSNQFDSVKKAFLSLDSDYDGYVTAEELIKIIGSGDTRFADLSKLVMDKDTTKTGKLNYTDFSKWLGGVIQMSEGFYFRHDSSKNPQCERFNEIQGQLKNKDKEAASKFLLTNPKTDSREDKVPMEDHKEVFQRPQH
jgi:Ca2+-binding EF-hand superfamily protein